MSSVTLRPCVSLHAIQADLGQVYLDQAYWQRAVASRPQTAVKAFMLAGELVVLPAVLIEQASHGCRSPSASSADAPALRC